MALAATLSSLGILLHLPFFCIHYYYYYYGIYFSVLKLERNPIFNTITLMLGVIITCAMFSSDEITNSPLVHLYFILKKNIPFYNCTGMCRRVLGIGDCGSLFKILKEKTLHPSKTLSSEKFTLRYTY